MAHMAFLVLFNKELHPFRLGMRAGPGVRQNLPNPSIRHARRPGVRTVAPRIWPARAGLVLFFRGIV